MSDKIKVLVVPSDRTGVSYFRSTVPHLKLEEFYPNDFHIDIDYEPQLQSDEYLKQYDIIHYHRTLGDYETLPKLLERCDNLGVVTIMDIDDHWSPGPDHPAWEIIKKHEIDKKIMNNLRVSRNIMTTTQVFADEIKKFNKNIHVIPNAVNPEEKQYISNPEKSDRIRIGWIGGSSHLKDLEILKGISNKFKTDKLLDKVQFVLCGFDLRGTLTMIDKQTGKETQRPIKPMESVWYEYERIITDDYRIVSEEYKKHLLKFDKTEYHNVANEPYRRVWTKPITSYASNYNLFDISIAPLKESEFNKVKSQLKVIEAGIHKKVIVAQDFGPYQIDVKKVYNKFGNIDETGNGFLIETDKNHKGWYNTLKYLVNNPEMITKIGDNLYNTIMGKYDIKSVCEERSKLYKKLISEKVSKNVEVMV